MCGERIVGGLRRAILLALLLLTAVFLPALAGAKPSSTPFSIEPGSFQVTSSTHRAGAHPDLTIAFNFSHGADGKTFNDVKDTVIDLPPGFAGAASAVPTCNVAQLIVETFAPECPLDSQVGTLTLEFVLSLSTAPLRWTLPVFNMERTGADTPAQLGFRALFFSQLIPMSLRPEDGGLTVDTPNIPLLAEPSQVSLTIWGIPASPSHDAERGHECTFEGEEGCTAGGHPSTAAARPFLDNPTRCGAATARLEANSWENPESWSKATAEAGPVVECELVPFDPSLEVQATTDAAESPLGIDLSVRVPQNADDPEALRSSSLASAALTLPEGVSINPASAAGVCTQEQFELETALPAPGRGCPSDAALGTAEIETPLVDEAAVGSVYLAKPFDNPGGSMLGLYVVARAPASGAFVRLAGRVLPDGASGRLRIVFDDIPQLPLSRLALHLPQRDDSLLVTPPFCGSYETQGELTPSADPAGPRRESASFQIARGVRGGPCPEAGKLPFHPELTVGSRKEAAGAFTFLDLHLRRRDGEAQISRFALTLPSGLTADLGGVTLCPDAALAAADAKTGAEERANPSCPAGSGLGRMLIGTGVGPKLARIRGSVHLAGPYREAPLSLATVAPAVLGPFDLGTVVARIPLRVDPRTGDIQIGSRRVDPIPQILSGIPLHLRDLDVDLSRARFLRNPTGCGPRPLEAALTPTASATPAAPLSLSVPFRARGCARLPFAPRLRLRLLGGVHRNGHPSLRIVLASRLRESGLAGAAIELPHTELLDPGNIRDICTAKRLAERSCPAKSAYGIAAAFTPLLSEPLKGPVYLRATKRGLPSLVAALHSRKLDFDLTARLEPVRGGIRIAPEDVPDLPISKLVLETRGGKHGLLVNSTDLCAGPRHAVASLLAQNGKRRDARLRLVIPCRRDARRGDPHTSGRRER